MSRILDSNVVYRRYIPLQDHNGATELFDILNQLAKHSSSRNHDVILVKLMYTLLKMTVLKLSRGASDEPITAAYGVRPANDEALKLVLLKTAICP